MNTTNNAALAQLLRILSCAEDQARKTGSADDVVHAVPGHEPRAVVDQDPSPGGARRAARLRRRR